LPPKSGGRCVPPSPDPDGDASPEPDDDGLEPPIPLAPSGGSDEEDDEDEPEDDEALSSERGFTGFGFDVVSEEESHLGADSFGGLEASAGGFDGPHAASEKTERRRSPRMRNVYHTEA
jgi:hypothetical protein